MEVEAFERARAFDSETIIRQNEMIAEQRRELDRLREENRKLSDELNACVRSQGDGKPSRVE
ncbi:hypothetical protein SEA_AVAZAK_33 [Gordonia phage Avazak]|uniref:Uncharacterized protein n=1 Tax=Gordonia phage Avazak TaxID=2656529 RepID=A0A649V7N9_9CAUD|nr:hypothetical protein HWC78_gp33 [Gordonia phage Avazak]QGJ88015.1 hypothetical protein SEA_AVAZAK_33 [Gordonia phage Avazak]